LYKKKFIFKNDASSKFLKYLSFNTRVPTLRNIVEFKVLDNNKYIFSPGRNLIFFKKLQRNLTQSRFWFNNYLLKEKMGLKNFDNKLWEYNFCADVYTIKRLNFFNFNYKQNIFIAGGYKSLYFNRINVGEIVDSYKFLLVNRRFIHKNTSMAQTFKEMEVKEETKPVSMISGEIKPALMLALKNLRNNNFYIKKNIYLNKRKFSIILSNLNFYSPKKFIRRRLYFNIIRTEKIETKKILNKFKKIIKMEIGDENKILTVEEMKKFAYNKKLIKLNNFYIKKINKIKNISTKNRASKKNEKKDVEQH
jgi:hypothetical protein